MTALRMTPSPCSLTRRLSVVLLLTAALGVTSAAQAQIGSDRYGSIVIEAGSGRVLSAVNPDEQRHPASLTKMMTLFMVFEALRDRRIGLEQLVPVSHRAAAMSPSKLGLLPGQAITVNESILGLVTKSANDAASALGELLGGDEGRFGQMMTLRARALGMSRTVFHNASGLPDPEQWSTPHDMALLARHLVHDFPNEYRYFSTPSFRFRGRIILSHDHMLETYPGADGIKTGYTEASGFNLVTSAVRGKVRLIGVVLGAAHAGERDLHMASLLDDGFGKLDIPVSAALRREPPVWTAAAIPAPPPAAHAALPTPPRPLRLPKWSVQVGAFVTDAAARQAAGNARRLAGVGEIHTEPVSVQGRTAWRAQLSGLSEAEARGTCVALAKAKQACALIRPDPGQVASR